jgi:hypothetical protein
VATEFKLTDTLTFFLAWQTSCTADIWSDGAQCPFLAITAHWIQCHPDGSLAMRADLAAFSYIPSSHSDTNIAKAAYAALEHGGLLDKVKCL